MLIRAKAPLRIGLAGGGTDVSPYADTYGGAILNATINLYAHATIEPLDDGSIILESIDLDEYGTFKSQKELSTEGDLKILKGVYNKIVQLFDLPPLSFKLTTSVDVPKGSGLGSSSTITVAIIGAFTEWLNLPLGEYDIARLAYQIERKDLSMAGGRQDQYAATFGGFNFMEFYEEDKVIVNPLRIKQKYLNELEFNMILYYTGTSRLSAKIIEKQSDNFEKKANKSLSAAHKLKEQAFQMKNTVLQGNLDEIGTLLDQGWHYKKQTAKSITNAVIDSIYQSAMDAGATGGKISGAGGGGFMIFYVPGTKRYEVCNVLEQFGGEIRHFNFTETGVSSWKI